MKVGGILLAGGLSRRMGGGDKCLLSLGGIPLLQHARQRLEPQVMHLAINANGEPSRFADFALPVLPDASPDFPGPLAGVLAGLRWAKASHPDLTHIATVPGDTPFFPADLVGRLCAAALQAAAPLACAASGGRAHPVFGLWPVHLADDLHHALYRENLRKIDLWTQLHGIAQACYATEPFDPFFNINRPEDMQQAAAILRAMPPP